MAEEEKETGTEAEAGTDPERFDPWAEKEKATEEGRPWVAVVASGFDPREESAGLWLELDWNERFIEHLREEGYRGKNDEELVDTWFRNGCMVYALATIPPEVAAVLATTSQWKQRVTISETRMGDDDSRVVYR